MSIKSLKITGGLSLNGEVNTSGSKNSILPILFSSLLAEGRHEFYNVPDLDDVHHACKILESLGLSCKKEPGRLSVETPSDIGVEPKAAHVKTMRASILCLGALLTRCRKAQISLPGGCVIGKRPIDYHINSLKALGASFNWQDDQLQASVDPFLKGAVVSLPAPSVGATENLLLAASLSEGKTVIQNAGIDPEIFDLINYLKEMGACISLTGTRELSIEGVTKLQPPARPYNIIPDRIEACSFLIAAAATKGEVLVKNCKPHHMVKEINKLREAGFILDVEGDSVFIRPSQNHRAVTVETNYYPEFSTDLQSQFLILMTQLEGISVLKENIFEARFQQVQDINNMGASIEVKKNLAYVRGPCQLKACSLVGRDLRGTASLVIASLLAEGESQVSELQYLLRGYENFPDKLRALGARIESEFSH